MNKVAVLSYHKNVTSLYPAEWIWRYRESILSQAYQDYDVYELNYGGGIERLFETSVYESKEFPSFIHGMNYLLDKIFATGYGAAANTNIDDYYHEEWLKTLAPYIDQGYDLVSCNFALLKDNETKPYHYHKFAKLNIREELDKNHNIIAHPAVLYSKRFWKNNRYVPEQFPEEDLQLWKRAITNYNFAIAPENLLYHRVHSNSVCQSENR